MARNYYYYKALRKTIIQFLDIFNDVKIKRYDANGNFVKYVDVPMKLAPKERMYYFRQEYKEEITLPMMSAMFNSIDFDSSRMGSGYHSLTKNVSAAAGTIKRFLNPVPFNIGFTVNIWSLYVSDIDQILEQILPYFTPHIFMRVHIPEVDFKFDVKVVFQSASPDYTSEYADEDRRILRFNLDFAIQAYLFRPVESTDLIKQIYINYYQSKSSYKASQEDTTTMFSSAASGESQAFTALAPYYDSDEEKIYKYEIFQFGSEIGTDIEYNT